MPMEKGKGRATIARNIAELHEGRQYRRTARKHGKATAHKQTVAIAMKEAGKSRKRTIAEGY